MLQTIAETAEGVEALAGRLDEHFSWLEQSGELGRKRRARLARRVREVVERRLLEWTWHEKEGEGILQEALPELESGAATPYEIAARIVRATAG